MYMYDCRTFACIARVFVSSDVSTSSGLLCNGRTFRYFLLSLYRFWMHTSNWTTASQTQLHIGITFINTSDIINSESIHTQKLSPYLVQYSYWFLCNFGLFLPKCGCHGFLENSNSIFEFTNPEDSTNHAKKISICCTQMKFVQFCLIFA